MSSKKIQKKDFINQILSKENIEDSVLKEFVENFYKHVSFGYLKSIKEQISLNTLEEISKLAFETFKKTPPNEAFQIKHYVLEKHNLQILLLHSFYKRFVMRSLKIWFASQGLVVDELIHPIFYPQRSKSEILSCVGGTDSESLIAVILPSSLSLPKNYEESLQELYKKLTCVVDDFPAMQKWAEDISENLLAQEDKDTKQTGAFLQWLKKEHFVFLGLRFYQVSSSSAKNIQFDQIETDKLGLFKIKAVNESKDFLLELDKTFDQLFQQHSMHIKKELTRSEIYRSSRINSIISLDIDKNGKVQGIVQIIGLFTADFYKTSPIDIPLLKDKALNVCKAFGFEETSYDHRMLKNIIDSIPLDEFYHLSEEQLSELIERILNMYNRNAIFIRIDDVNNLLFLLLYIPKHRYSEKLRVELGEFIAKELGGKLTSTHGQVGETSFARLAFIFNFDTPIKTDIDLATLEEKVWMASQTWREKFTFFCRKKSIPSSVIFSDIYPKLHSPEIAAEDTATLLNWLAKNENIYFEAISRNGREIIRVFQKNDPITLGQITPVFTNFQLNIQSEHTFFADIDNQRIWIHHYDIANLSYLKLPSTTLEKLVEGLKAAWTGLIEVDPFNGLTVCCGLDFKEIIILRAYGRFLKQLGFNYSQKALADCLGTYPSITQLLIKYFTLSFSLELSNINNHSLEIKNLSEQIIEEFSLITRLDHDRIMRRFHNAITSTLRTNAYQSGFLNPYPCVSFKVSSSKIIDVPSPAPLFEIFVYSTTMEGCHLRGGKIARGGIRWSDRPEDFRYEVLGLMKAQMVKNSVIVPLGSKGGFVVKNYNALQESGYTNQDLKLVVINAYKAFIEQLLTLTDNLVDNKIEPPKQVVRYDNDDQYLVVAADKGTATFSDIANKISEEKNFWLGDAFASGGSKGYDHKKLGITARGAWIAVRRHFWEMGIDCQTMPITTIGVGDMAGDVFGNGMLQSKKICLLGAFNHKHIFLDPTPDPDLSYQERKRLFDSLGDWEAYDLSKISKGGGVYKRSEKTIKISPEVSKIFKIVENELSPDELISRLLQASVDLLFFGGIGTFIKSKHEGNISVADKANDAIRVDAGMVNAKVIGEGANLGVTQSGRIEYALKGGRINTDAIDNSAGVDCSDHEVNLKIMCQVLLQNNIINTEKRDELLASLEEEVSELVLNDNWMQTLTLSIMQQESFSDVNAYINLIKNLEIHQDLPLKINVENIPSEEELLQRKSQQQGLTRPELAVLLAYSKIHLYQDMLHALQNTACFGETFYLEYFPKHFQTEYRGYLKYHPLKVEITATVLANLIINTMGPCFAKQVSEAFQVDTLEVVRAFVEVLEQTNFYEQLLQYKTLDHDQGKTLKALRNITQNIAQCVMIRLSSPQRIFSAQLKNIQNSSLPFSILFAYQACHREEIDIYHVNKIYQELNLSYLWEWTATICPNSSWQNSSWLLLQHDLIQVITKLCLKDWSKENLAIYHEFSDQIKKNISSTTDSSQHLLLLDYAIRKLQKL